MKSKSENEKLDKGFIIAEIVVAGVFTLAYIAIFILTGAGLIKLGICIVWLLFALYSLKSKKRNYVACLAETVIMAMIAMFLVLWAPFMVHTRFAYRYPFQKAYITIFNGKETFQYLPDSLPKGIKGYRLDYLPSILQGTGYTTVSFEAPEDVIESYTKEYSENAVYTCRLSELAGGSIIQENGNDKGAAGINAEVYIDDKFRAKCSDEAMVYIMYMRKDSLRSSYTSAVIIDSENQLVEFTKIG